MSSPFKKFPESLYPECWRDENRVNVLFAPFRNKGVNPKDWDSKYEFWRNLIKSYCVNCKQSYFKIEDLQKVFLRDGRTPACLPDVIREMYKNHDLQDVKDFTNIPADTWTGWATDLIIKKPIIWSVNKLKSSVINNADASLTYVHAEALKTIVDDLVKALPKDSKSNLLDIKTLAEIEQQQIDNINLLLNYMLINRKCSVREINTGDTKTTLIKFTPNGEKISDREVDIFTLECTEKIISKTIEKYENDIKSTIKDVKSHLLKGHRQLAKTSLKKKREIEKRIESRANALFNVQTLLIRIDDVEDDGKVIDSYKKALSSLRTTFKDGNLNEDAVANTMLELAEVLDIHDDVQTSLSQPVREEDADLEAELAELMATEPEDNKTPKPTESPTKKQWEDSADDVTRQLSELQLPEVPTHSPLDFLDGNVNRL